MKTNPTIKRYWCQLLIFCQFVCINICAQQNIHVSPAPIKKTGIDTNKNARVQSSVPPCNENRDFNYIVNPCSPLDVGFVSVNNDFTAIRWLYEDGATVLETIAGSHTFLSYGNHKVSMIADKGTCADTITKVISLDVTTAKFILTPDTTICPGSKTQLRAGYGLAYCWSPSTYLDNVKSGTPITSTPVDITYYCTASNIGNNLIVNGDFANGNTGFTSEYSYATPNITEGQYYVGPNPSAWNPNMSSCTDHTNGSGNMMLVNGSPVNNVNVWKQTVAVTPNTNYAFSTWIEALWPPNPALLQFAINDVQTGFLIFPTLPTCTWTRFFTTWNSGNSTTAVISIVNKNTEIIGNDFALDDISFAPVYMQRDSVVIKVDKATLKSNNDTTVCAGKQVQLNATSNFSSYTWSPATGLSNANIPNPIATPATNTDYVIAATTPNGCVAKDTVQINITPAPIISKTADVSICHDKTLQLNVSGGNFYSWLPNSSLSNTSIANPIVSPLANTTYYVTVTGSNNCSSSDSIKISVIPAPVFTVSAPATSCKGSPAQLIASGGSSYSWQPSADLNNATIANPLATPEFSETYTVKIVENTCKDSASLTTAITVLQLPVVNATSSNDVDCVKPVSQLNASGAVSYTWQPAASLNDSAIAAPLSSPSENTWYIVKGKAANGCSNYDSVQVLVTKKGDLIINLPNAFTPNGDYIDDCFGISRYAGLLKNIDFSVYDRFGLRVFHSTNASDCWDGRYKGKLQNTGGFAYILKASTFCGEILKKGIVMLLK